MASVWVSMPLIQLVNSSVSSAITGKVNQPTNHQRLTFQLMPMLRSRGSLDDFWQMSVATKGMNMQIETSQGAAPEKDATVAPDRYKAKPAAQTRP